MGKPRRNFKKSTKSVTKRTDMPLSDAIKKAFSLQEFIDKYNDELLNEEVASFFSHINLGDSSVIIRPFKENYVKGFSDETKTITAAGFRMIDNRKRSTDQEDYSFTPIKVINAGILVAASPEFLLQRGMSLGDIVYTRPIQWRTARFYVNRQDSMRDHVSSPDNYSLSFFEGYFNISQFDIELSIPVDTFKENYADMIMSPIFNKITIEELIQHHEDLQKANEEEQKAQFEDRMKESSQTLQANDLTLEAMGGKTTLN